MKSIYSILIYCVLAYLPVHAAEYAGEGFFGGKLAVAACGDGADHALASALADHVVMNLHDYHIASKVRFEEKVSDSGTPVTVTHCSATLDTLGLGPSYPKLRPVYKITDSRNGVSSGQGASLEAACADAEKQLLSWSKYDNGLDQDVIGDELVYASRLIDRSYNQGKSWDGIPYATCAVTREFSRALISTNGKGQEVQLAADSANACARNLQILKSQAQKECEGMDLALETFTIEKESVDQPRGRLAKCTTWSSYTCFQK